MTLYTPREVTETDSVPPWTDCSPAAGAMLVDFHTHGAVRVTHQQLRAASGVPSSQGMGLADLRLAIARVTGIELPIPQAPTFVRTTFADLQQALRRGQGAVVQGLYRNLPTYYRRWDSVFTGGHAAYTQGDPYDPSNGPAWWMDPLARGPYNGELMAWTVLNKFVQSYANSAGDLLVALLPAPALPPTDTAQGDPMLVRKWEKWHSVAAGAPIYDGIGGKVIGSFPGGTELRTAGESIDGAWRLVAESGTGGVDPKWTYVQRASIIPEVPGGDPAYEARVNAAFSS